MLAVGRMEDEEGPEYGKPDFVLLDQLTMEDFMKNLELRNCHCMGQRPLPSTRAASSMSDHLIFTPWPMLLTRQ
uniref:Myosin IG n=1 Tax=Mus musculus TaxID=10090 RepID=D6RGA2_MOUSE